MTRTGKSPKRGVAVKENGPLLPKKPVDLPEGNPLHKRSQIEKRQK
jgi:predicted DNA-binding antitoxin AbrB/MazE fold protein